MTAEVQEQPRARSRWWRYSLRSLFALVLLMSIGLAVYVWLLQELHQQQAIAAELTELGCTVEWDRVFDPESLAMTKRVSTTPQWLIDLLGGDPHRQLNAVTCHIDNAEQLQGVQDAIDRLPYATRLFLKRGEVGSSPLAFRAQPELQMLEIDRVNLTRNSLLDVGRMQELQSLTLYDCTLNDQDVDSLGGLSCLLALNLSYSVDISSLCLPTSAAMPSLARLILIGTKVTDDNLELLQRMPALRELDLTETQITDAGIPKLAELPQLQTLVLGFTTVSSGCLPAIADLSTLVDLRLTGTRVSDANLELLQKLPDLSKLNLDATDITDAAIPKLAKLAKLQELDLSYTLISGAGLSVFANQSLRRLDLTGTQIGDDCLDELTQCQNLEWLSVPVTSITPAGLALLKQALPKTEIID